MISNHVGSSERARRWLLGKLHPKGREFTPSGVAPMHPWGLVRWVAATSFFTKREQGNEITSAPGGHALSSSGRLMIETSDGTKFIPTILLEVTDPGSAQSGIKGQPRDLTSRAQIWGFSALFSSENRISQRG